MDVAAWHAARSATLWSVRGHRLRETYAPGAQWWWDNRKRQPEESVVVQYVRRGRMIWRESGNDQEIGPGDMLLFAFGEETAYGRPSDRPEWPGHADHLQMDHVTLHGAGLRTHWDLLRSRQGSIIAVSNRAPCLTALRELCTGATTTQRIGATTLIERVAQVARFVAALSVAVEAAAGATRIPVERAIEALFADPCAEHNLKQIAKRSGCSREHLSRVFLERVGMPPVTWLRQRRLAHAITLLRDTRLPISDIAVQCGAGSVHRLARWTHAEHQVSPSVLAQRLRREASERKPAVRSR